MANDAEYLFHILVDHLDSFSGEMIKLSISNWVTWPFTANI